MTDAESKSTLDELSQSQLVRLWLEGKVSAEDALASMHREGSLDSEKIMDLVAHKLEMERLT